MCPTFQLQDVYIAVFFPPLRGVKASHILLSGEGRVYLSGLHSVYSMMREGKKMRAVFDMPHHSPALLPWLSPELLRQVRPRSIDDTYDTSSASLQYV